MLNHKFYRTPYIRKLNVLNRLKLFMGNAYIGLLINSECRFFGALHLQFQFFLIFLQRLTPRCVTIFRCSAPVIFIEFCPVLCL